MQRCRDAERQRGRDAEFEAEMQNSRQRCGIRGRDAEAERQKGRDAEFEAEMRNSRQRCRIRGSEIEIDQRQQRTSIGFGQ